MVWRNVLLAESLTSAVQHRIPQSCTLPLQETKELTEELFGRLAPLSHEEHYDLFRTTGVDIDGR